MANARGMRGKGSRRAWVARGCVALVLASPAAVASAQPTNTYALTVAASRSAAITVALAQSTLDVTKIFTSPDVTISGRGRIIGVALRPVTPANAMPALVLAQLQSCYRSACAGKYREQFVSGTLVTHTGRVVVPAGRYLLQAFTDGAPVAATLRLHGSGHSQTLRPSKPVSYTVESPQSTLGGTAPVTPGMNVAPGHYTIRRPGIEAFVFGQIEWKAGAGGDFGGCFYDADVPVVLPECAGGSGITADGVLVDPAPATQILYADYSSSADVGPSTAGFALAHASVATFVGSNVAWLES